MQRLRKVVSTVLVALGILFVVYVGLRHWEQLSLAFERFDRSLFALSVAAGVLGNLGIALLFRSLMTKHKASVSAAQATTLFYMSQVTKYIPGKVWGILYQASRVEGAAGSVAIVLANVELMGIAALTNIIIAIVLISAGSNPLLAGISLAAGILLTSLIVIANPLRFARAFIDRKLGIASPEEVTRGQHVLFDFTAYWLSSGIFVLANLALLSAFFDLGTVAKLQLIGYLLIASALSVVVVVMPAGIGIKEVLFLLIAGASNEYYEGLLVTVAIVSRFWQVSMDLCGAALVVALRRFAGNS